MEHSRSSKLMLETSAVVATAECVYKPDTQLGMWCHVCSYNLNPSWSKSSSLRQIFTGASSGHRKQGPVAGSRRHTDVGSLWGYTPAAVLWPKAGMERKLEMWLRSSRRVLGDMRNDLHDFQCILGRMILSIWILELWGLKESQE